MNKFFYFFLSVFFLGNFFACYGMLQTFEKEIKKLPAEENFKSMMLNGGKGSTVGASFNYFCYLGKEDPKGMQGMFEDITLQVWGGRILRATGSSLGLFGKMVDGLMRKQKMACAVFQEVNGEEIDRNEEETKSIIADRLREAIKKTNLKNSLIEGTTEIAIGRILGSIENKPKEVSEGFSKITTIPGMSRLVNAILGVVAKNKKICVDSSCSMAKKNFLEKKKEES